MLLPGKKTPTFSVILRKGHVDVDLPEQSPPKLAVAVGTTTDTRVVTLSGKMSLRAEGANVTTVNYQGLTTVTQGTKLMRLPTNVKRVYLGKSGSVDQPLLSATGWVGGKRIFLAIRNTVKVSGYTWSTVAGAVAYDLTLLDKQNGRIYSQNRVVEPRFETEGVRA